MNDFDRSELVRAFDHAELALAGGDARAALATVEELAERCADSGSQELVDRRAVIRAGALEAVGDLGAAILQLEELVAKPKPTAEWLRCLIALSRCYRETGDLDRAIAVGEGAEAQVRDLGLTGLTEWIQLTVTVAASYAVRGEPDRAMRLCLRAIDDAEQIRSPIAKASAYMNASKIEESRGSIQRALDLAREALVAFEIDGDDSRIIAGLRGNIARLQLQLDPPDPRSALATLERADRELRWSRSNPADRAQHFQIRARANLLLGRTEEARSVILEGIAQTPEGAVIARALDHAVLGEVELAAGNVDRAKAALRTAVHLLSGAGADREAAQLWFDLGVRLSEMGEDDAAADAFHRAAASTGLHSGRGQNSLPSELT
jgi:tetratricopeptide (TPR) repeat protein